MHEHKTGTASPSKSATGNVTFIAGVPYTPYPGNDYPFGYGPQVRTDSNLDLDPKFDDPFWSH